MVIDLQVVRRERLSQKQLIIPTALLYERETASIPLKSQSKKNIALKTTDSYM